MLLDWLACGAPQRFAFESPEDRGALAGGVARRRSPICTSSNLFPHRLLRLDDIAHDPAALATSVGEALDITLPPPQSLGASAFRPGPLAQLCAAAGRGVRQRWRRWRCAWVIRSTEQPRFVIAKAEAFAADVTH